MRFQDRIKYIRGGITQKDFAKKIGVSLGSVQHWEIDGQLPRGDILRRIKEMLGVNINWLLTGVGEPYCQENSSTPTEGLSYNTPPSAPLSVTEVLPQINTEKATRDNPTIIQHVEVVKQFTDCEMAKMANMELLSIERINPQAFREVVAYIKGISNGLKLAQNRSITNSADNPSDRRSGGDRRQSGEDPEKPPNGSDRRSGRERRKAAGSGEM